MVKIIVSLTSTRSSSNPFVDIVITPDVSPALITSGDDVIVYSLVSAVPERVYGIVISRFEVSETFAVIFKLSEEFSVIVSELNSKLTVGGLSPSTRFILIEFVTLLDALDAVWGISVIDSSFSSEESSLDVIVIDPVVSPADTVISGFETYLWILWFSASAIYTLLSVPTNAAWGLFNWFIFDPFPLPPAIISPSLAPGVQRKILFE